MASRGEGESPERVARDGVGVNVAYVADQDARATAGQQCADPLTPAGKVRARDRPSHGQRDRLGNAGVHRL